MQVESVLSKKNLTNKKNQTLLTSGFLDIVLDERNQIFRIRLFKE